MIYIQSNERTPIPHHFDCACAMYGAMDLGQDYRLTYYMEVESGKFDNNIKKSLFVGSVEFMKVVFNRVGLKDIRLPENSNRSYQIMSLGDIKTKAKLGEKFFIKPIDIKLFTGFVIDQMDYTSIKNIPNDTNVMVYEPFKHSIQSEWRCYIHNHNLVYIANYSGDCFVNVDISYLTNIIRLNKNTFPCAYTIDIGILSNGDNVVIEYNDMWAIGNYGIPNNLYTRMLRDRYFQIIKTC